MWFFFCIENVQEDILSNKLMFFWWPNFHFSNKCHWGWRVCGEVQSWGEGDCGTSNTGLNSLFLKWLLMTTCLFYSWIYCFVSCSGHHTERACCYCCGRSGAPSNCIFLSSAKLPVTVSFSYTHSVSSSEDLLAVICDKYVFSLFILCQFTSYCKKLWFMNPRPKGLLIPLNLILEAHSCKFFWPAAYLVREMIKDYMLWVSVLVIHPMAKMRIGKNIFSWE